MCNSVSIKIAVQKTAVGSAKNGGRGLEKNPTQLFSTNLDDLNKNLGMN
jgi:hypothetical protein